MSERDKPGLRPINRRSLLKWAGAGAAAGALPAGAAAATPAEVSTPPSKGAMNGMSMPAPKPRPSECAPARAVYEFLNPQEAAFVEAAVAMLIPADDLGPGALECGVAVFIDRQLGGEYGRGDRLYLQGPFAEGTPEQGYQLRMTPGELVQTGIADVDAYSRETHRAGFADLSPDERAGILSGLETRQVQLANVPAGTFFEVLYELTVQGFFADPIHGGNRDKASWKMLGFPGIGGMYADKIAAFRNRLYVSDPIGIEDLL